MRRGIDVFDRMAALGDALLARFVPRADAAACEYGTKCYTVRDPTRNICVEVCTHYRCNGHPPTTTRKPC